MKLLIGTNNPSKLRRMEELLAGANVSCVSPAELGLCCDVPESAATAAGNALEKALAWHRACGLPVYTEDSGLVFLDLPRHHVHQPGVHVRRVQGVTMDDDTMREYYRSLAHAHGGRLVSAWQSAHCLLFSEEDHAIFEDDDDLLRKHAFLLTDQDNGKRLPGWPLESLKGDAQQIISDEDKALYWEYVQSWLCEQIALHQ